MYTYSALQRERRPAWPCLLLTIFTIVIGLALGPLHAQVADPSEPPAGVTVTATTDAAETEPDAGPIYPARLADPSIPLEELELRLLPLNVEQLNALATAWQDIVAHQTLGVVEATLEAERLEDDRRNAALERIVALAEIRDLGFAHFTAVVNELDRKGGDEAVVAKFRSYRSSIIVEEKQRADWRTLFSQALNWLASPDGGVELGIRGIVVLATFFGLLIVAKITRGYARRLLARIPTISKLLQSFFAMVIYWLTIVVGLMIALSALGVDITPVFALFGGGAFILAFAMQETLGNLAAGLMIMINRPFDEGHYVDVAGVAGTVNSVSIVSTTVTTPDNQVIVIPNSKVWGNIITNVTASKTRRVDLVFGIGYSDSIEEAQRVLEDVVSANPLVLDDPAPVIRVSELADSSVNFIVRPWAKTEDYWALHWDLQRSVKEAFDQAGISIPFPQTDMHLHVADQNSTPFEPVGEDKQSLAGEKRSKTSQDYARDDGDHSADKDEERQ